MSAAEMAARERVSGRQVSTWALVATGAWCLESAVYAMQVQVSGSQGGQSVDFGAALVQSLVSALLWVPLTLLVLSLSFRWPVTAGRWNWVVHLGGFICVVVARAACTVMLNPLVGWYPNGPPPWPELLVSSVLNNMVTYILLTGLAHSVFYLQRIRVIESRFAAARLDALTSQLQPHFLFNALNTIAALIPSRPEAAERMVVDLAALLRFSVDRDSAELIALQEEIEIGQAYLKIEEHRFANRLRVRIEIADEVREAAVPPFLLQPLLENAVRHGLTARPGANTLEIRAVRVGEQVQIVVADDGAGLSRSDEAVTETGREGRRPGGVGLLNVRERLRSAYGSDAQLVLADLAGGGVVATVTLPLRRVVEIGVEASR